ncbi:recombinase [Clostridia bacterium]|nr:recombinase [Clostridia bacterium]
MGRRDQSRNSPPSGKRVWKVALYIRLSREDGNDVSNSVKHQKERLLAYLADFGDGHELVDVYIDDGYTGTDTNRDSFQRMCRHIREHRVNCVIVKDLSRLSRNVTDATYHIETFFIEYDVRFISLELPALDSYKYPEQMNSILVPMQNVINDDFCRQTSIKVRGIFNQKRRQGQFIGAFAPYGFMKDPDDKHSLIIDGEAAQIVRDIFRWYVKEGVSKGNIVRRLNELGIPNPAAYKKLKGMRYANPSSNANDTLWNPRTVRDILSNQMYLGHMVQGKYRVKSYKVHTQIATPKEEWYIVENTHDPIIEQEVFDMAQRLQEKDTRTPPGSKTVHTLSGYVRCAGCKKAMVRSQGGGKVKRTYYQCRTHREKSKEACGIHSIRAEILEDAVFNAIRAQVGLASSLQDIVDAINRAPNVRNEPRRLSAIQKAREKELAKITAIGDSLYEDWKNGDITKADYRRLKAKYEEQSESLRNTIASLKEERRVMSGGVGAEDPYLQAFLKYHGITTLERGAIVDLIDTIYVHEGGAIEILFSFQDQHRLVIDSIESNAQELPLIESGRTSS